jgi:hypothetical protein
LGLRRSESKATAPRGAHILVFLGSRCLWPALCIFSAKPTFLANPDVGIFTGIPRPYEIAHPPRIPLGPWASAHCRGLGEGVFSWARYACIVEIPRIEIRLGRRRQIRGMIFFGFLRRGLYFDMAYARPPKHVTKWPRNLDLRRLQRSVRSPFLQYVRIA